MKKLLFIALSLISFNCCAEKVELSSTTTEVKLEANVEANMVYSRERRVVPITTSHFVGIHNNTGNIVAIHISYRIAPYNHPICEIVKDINIAPGQVWRDSTSVKCEVKYMRAGTKPYVAYTTVSIDGVRAREVAAQSDVIVSEY